MNWGTACPSQKDGWPWPDAAMSLYLVIIEPTDTGFSAYSPDVPGCIATGATRCEVEQEMHSAIEFHLEGLRLEGIAIPTPKSDAAFCEVEVAS